MLPLVALFVVRRERRPRVWALALLCFLIPCIYWYARNALMTGDPFNPIGARLFGFTNWNAADYKNQIDDVRAHAAWPNGALWGVLFVPFGLAWKRSPAVRAAAIFSAYSLLVWVVTSRYPRYLTASVPLLALVAVAGWQALLGRRRPRRAAARCRAATSNALDLLGRSLGVLLMAFTVGVSFQLTRQRLADGGGHAGRSARPSCKAACRATRVMDYLREHATGRVYQIGAERGDLLRPVAGLGRHARAPGAMPTSCCCRRPISRASWPASASRRSRWRATRCRRSRRSPASSIISRRSRRRTGAKAYRILAPQHDE